MLEHPWIELQLLIKEKWLTQKAFSSILWKKVSEVNELLKWKRNITIQRDYLLHQTLWTPIKYWILKQIDYDYSLIDTEDISLPVSGVAEQRETEELSESHSHSEALAEESNWTNILPPFQMETSERQGDLSEQQQETEPQNPTTQEPENKIDEDYQNRANIFRSF